MGRQLYQDSNYTDRLLKLIPVEFVSVYLVISQLVASEPGMRQQVLVTVIVLFSLLIPLYLKRIQKVKNRWQIVLTVVSFWVWTYSLGGAFVQGIWFQNIHNPIIASVLLLLWTGITPLFIPLQAEGNKK